MSKKTWWRWAGTPQHEHGRATYYCNTVNETTVSLPNFEQAFALAMAIEAQARETRQDARAGLLSAISRPELLAAAKKVNALSIQTEAHMELRAAIAKATEHDA